MKFWNSFTLILLFAFSVSSNLFAVVTPTNNDTEAAISTENLVEEAYPAGVTLTKKQMKKKARMEKALTKFEKRLNKVNAKRALKGKAGIDFSDPVDKWMWFWIFGWAAAIILPIIAAIVVTGTLTGGGFGIGLLLVLLASLAGLFGTISLIIWLIKKFS